MIGIGDDLFGLGIANLPGNYADCDKPQKVTPVPKYTRAIIFNRDHFLQDVASKAGPRG